MLQLQLAPTPTTLSPPPPSFAPPGLHKALPLCGCRAAPPLRTAPLLIAVGIAALVIVARVALVALVVALEAIMAQLR
jgi:hypothetical protein